MISALALSFAVIFIAELGDKSQLMAMAFALRLQWWLVLIGITIATTAVHALSVIFGHFLGLSIPAGLSAVIAGVAMLIFGFWTLRGDSLSATDIARASRVTRSAIIAVASAFFLAELGDKTMLATITLAAKHNWFGIWIGSTLGMVAADALAICLGKILAQRFSARSIAVGAAISFFAFGCWLIFDGYLQYTT